LSRKISISGKVQPDGQFGGSDRTAPSPLTLFQLLSSHFGSRGRRETRSDTRRLLDLFPRAGAGRNGRYESHHRLVERFGNLVPNSHPDVHFRSKAEIRLGRKGDGCSQKDWTKHSQQEHPAGRRQILGL